MIISAISFIGKGDSKVIKDTPTTMGYNDAKQYQRYMKDNKQVEEVQSTKQAGKQVAISTYSKASILRYVPKSRRKEGESPFTGVANGDAEDKVIRKANEASMTALKESAMVPRLKVSRPSL